MGRLTRTERGSLAIAIAVHAMALAVARREVARVVSAPRAEDRDVAIEVELAESAAASTEPRAAIREPPATEERAIAARSSVRSFHAPKHETLTDAPSASEPAPSAPVEPKEAPPAPPPMSLAQLGLVGPNRFVDPAAAAPPGAREAEDGVRRSIAASLLKHDRSVGLGLEGPVVAAIEEVVMASTAATNGRAVLDVVADALGVVAGVVCVEGDRAAWDAIAAGVASALRNKRLRAAPGGRGVSMRIEVTSREEVSSGRDPGVEVRAFHLPVKRGRGPRATRVDILDVAPKVVIDKTDSDEDPSSGQAAPVRFPRAHIQIVTLLGIDFDPADIGSTARRVVHTRVLEENPL